MKRMLWMGGLVLGLSALVQADVGAPPEVQQLRNRIDELERTVVELKRENATLRTQWGQATLEIDRLRRKLASRENGTGPGDATPPTDAAAAAADDDANQAAPVPPVAQNDDVERLRRENQDLRSQNQELTQLAGLGPGDERVASQEARIQSTFDESTGRTIVRTEQDKLRMTAGSRADHFLSLAYSYSGHEMTSPPQEVTMFIQALYSGGIYKRDQILELVVDGEPLRLAVDEYDVQRRRTNLAGRRGLRKDDETLTFLLDETALRRLARAVSVTGRVGVASFELTRDQIALFTAIYKRINQGL